MLHKSTNFHICIDEDGYKVNGKGFAAVRKLLSSPGHPCHVEIDYGLLDSKLQDSTRVRVLL